MGMYASAKLYYGQPLDGKRDEYGEIDFENDSPVWYDDDEESGSGGILDIDDIVAKARDIASPYDLVPREVYNGPYGEFQKWEAEHPEWRVTQERWAELKRSYRDAAPVAIEHYGHCEDDEPRALLVLKAAPSFNADTWEIADVVLPSPESLRDETIVAQGYCEALGLDFSNPRWLLVASYG